MVIPFLSALLFLFSLSFFPILFPSCASVGNPTGGPYDTIPPVFIQSKPAPNSTNFSGNKVELLFNEYLFPLESKNVIITPPQSRMPVIKSIGKKVTVELKDTLVSNTTYTFDFTNGIADNNEKNAIEGFTFAFSTGDVVDSMVVSGTVLNAQNLEPMPNIIVGLHSNLADSAFTTIPFLRTSVTNDKGQFWIRNVAPGTYKLYALNDMRRGYKYDQPGTDIAFSDSLIIPDFVPAIRMDTIRRDSLTIDTIKEVHYNRFIPDDAMLFLFKENRDKQYLTKFERPAEDRRQLILRFNSVAGLPPTLNLLKDSIEKIPSADWSIPEYSNDQKNITYWITDSLIYKQDTIWVEANYLMSDSIDNLVPITDTLRFVWRNKEAPKKDNKKGKETVVKPDFLKIDLSAKSVMEVFDTLKITFSEPVSNPDLAKIKIQQKVDTLWEDKNFPIIRDTLNSRLFYVDHEWPYDQTYRITIDSASFFSIYDKYNDSIGTTFKFNSEKEYGNLYVKITGSEGPGFGELLDGSDKVVCKSPLKDGEIAFEDLKAGKYYMRYTEDTNGNGIWDTGNYAERLQPERVYYFNDALTIAKYSSNDQDWDIRQFPVDKQKPLEITKNKPAAKQQKKTQQQQNQNKQNAGQSSNPLGRSIPGIGGRMPSM